MDCKIHIYGRSRKKELRRTRAVLENDLERKPEVGRDVVIRRALPCFLLTSLGDLSASYEYPPISKWL